MRRVTNEDIILINEAYKACGTYSGAAAATGWSASTVKKYIIADYKSEPKPITDNISLPLIEVSLKALQENNLTLVRKDEEADLRKLWSEMIV